MLLYLMASMLLYVVNISIKKKIIVSSQRKEKTLYNLESAITDTCTLYSTLSINRHRITRQPAKPVSNLQPSLHITRQIV